MRLTYHGKSKESETLHVIFADVAQRCDVLKTDAPHIVFAFLRQVAERLCHGDEVQLQSFGSFVPDHYIHPITTPSSLLETAYRDPTQARHARLAASRAIIEDDLKQDSTPDPILVLEALLSPSPSPSPSTETSRTLHEGTVRDPARTPARPLPAQKSGGPGTPYISGTVSELPPIPISTAEMRAHARLSGAIIEARIDHVARTDAPLKAAFTHYRKAHGKSAPFPTGAKRTAILQSDLKESLQAVGWTTKGKRLTHKHSRNAIVESAGRLIYTALGSIPARPPVKARPAPSTSPQQGEAVAAKVESTTPVLIAVPRTPPAAPLNCSFTVCKSGDYAQPMLAISFRICMMRRTSQGDFAMWLISPDLGFISVIAIPSPADRPAPRRVVIRFRSRQHLRKYREAYPDLLGGLPVEERIGADYQGGRLTVTVEVLGELLRRLAERVVYNNVKSEAERVWGFDDPLVEAMHDCWSALLRIQHDPRHRQDSASGRPPRRHGWVR